MGMKTGKISFNVNERGRDYIGADRRFDLRALGALVNGPVVQERVRNRDLLGYYGHSLRMRFGLMPPETVIVKGEAINIEPALVTTYLAADDQGNVEHETEFLDTVPGKVAQRMHESRTGGFSSAIKANSRGGFDVPAEFGGFDYVMEPNVTTNRGYVFDSASVDEHLVLDSAMVEFNRSNAAMNLIFDSLNGDLNRALEAIAHMREENEELLSMLAASKGAVVLDSAGGYLAPSSLSKGATDDFRRRASGFDTASLAGFERLSDDDGPRAPDIADVMRQRWGA